MHEAREAGALGDQLAAESDDEGAPAEVVHVRRHLAEPADESFRMLRRGHGYVCSFFKF
jgi:hypothetical protein